MVDKTYTFKKKGTNMYKYVQVEFVKILTIQLLLVTESISAKNLAVGKLVFKCYFSPTDKY